jgi:formylglycine-generating enzyme required for sulfatase activity
MAFLAHDPILAAPISEPSDNPTLDNKSASTQVRKKKRRRKKRKSKFPVIKPIPLVFVHIPAGEFLMGSDSGKDNEKPVHKVTISHPFEISKYEVTKGQWQDVMRDHPSGRYLGVNLPVVGVSWNYVQQFILELNFRKDGYTYRLPTEAEWEYACRAGTTGDYYGKLDEIAWYEKNMVDEIYPVGQKKPNAWGLYDMVGNAWEWCQDVYGEDYYKQSPSIDPQGPEAGEERVVRGGGWKMTAENTRAASRFGYPAKDSVTVLGFRLVRTRN